MNYRRLGRAGIKVSELSFGSWVTFGSQIGIDQIVECMSLAYESGVNFFDNAEVYAKGESEELMGEALKRLKWPRKTYLVSTKFFWGIEEQVNLNHTLNRKYLMQAIDKSLARLQLEFVDLVYCHRPDPETPIEETVYAMHDIISRGKALYWGTSEWGAEAIAQAWEIADRHHLHKPVTEQPQYNLLHRGRVEREYLPIFQKLGIGTTVWSPLASGVLTGKYLKKSRPRGSRLVDGQFSWLSEKLLSPQVEDKVARLKAVADGLEVSLAQLSIAWCLKNQNVSTVILGATNAKQLKENLAARSLVERLGPQAIQEIDAICQPGESLV